jgi:hypothetical protein
MSHSQLWRLIGLSSVLLLDFGARKSVVEPVCGETVPRGGCALLGV